MYSAGTVLITSPSECASQCSDGPAAVATSTYSFFRRSDGRCQCLQSSYPQAQYVKSSGSGVDICNEATDFSVYRLRTTFNFESCYTTTFQEATVGRQSFTSRSIETCFINCRTSTGVLISAVPRSDSYNCACQSAQIPSSAFATPFACVRDTDTFYYYSHPAPATISGGQLRRRRAGKSEREDYCPGSLTACRIEGSDDGYECIDTSSELESCGGCLYGQYGRARGRSQGVNCADLADQDFGSMTCQRGQCVEAF